VCLSKVDRHGAADVYRSAALTHLAESLSHGTHIRMVHKLGSHGTCQEVMAHICTCLASSLRDGMYDDVMAHV